VLIFDWDDANRRHIARHDVLPEEAEQVIRNKPIDIEGQERKGEKRIMQLGHTDAGRILLVITTFRRERLRVVTAFPASRAFRSFYHAQKKQSSR
jgi:uncharacterized DUF497 family protein